MKNVMKLVLILALVAAGYSAYSFGRGAGKVSENQGGLSTSQYGNSLTGKVAETMNSGGYTYINLEQDGKNTWVSIPQSEVKVGQEVSVMQGMPMSNFESKTLNRTFESIIFSPGLVSGPAAGTASAPHSSATSAKVTDEPIKVDKAAGPDAFTVAELYDKKSSLDSKTVAVRGKVVKVSAGIMNTNWIHIQDGSGNAAVGTHDLLITSDEIPSVGDVITANGKVVNDKDIGSGYKFAVMLEKAEIKK